MHGSQAQATKKGKGRRAKAQKELVGKVTPDEYLKIRKEHEFTRRAKYLVKYCNSASSDDVMQRILFKQESGYWPNEYLEKHKNGLFDYVKPTFWDGKKCLK